MSAIGIPGDVAAHLQAAIQLTNRRVQMRLLHEADVALAQKLPSAAVVVAGAVLESALEEAPIERYATYSAEIERWRMARNVASHSASSELTLEQATEMVRGIRKFLTELPPVPETTQPLRRTAADQLRGKYKHVATSSEAFMDRKADELSLER